VSSELVPAFRAGLQTWSSKVGSKDISKACPLELGIELFFTALTKNCMDLELVSRRGPKAESRATLEAVSRATSRAGLQSLFLPKPWSRSGI
jgi:hypothetical protein